MHYPNRSGGAGRADSSRESESGAPSEGKLPRRPPSLEENPDNASLSRSDERAGGAAGPTGEEPMIREARRGLPASLSNEDAAKLEQLRAAAVKRPNDVQALRELASAVSIAQHLVDWRAPLHEALAAEHGEICRGIVQLAPRDLGGRAGLARCLVNSGRFEEALPHADTAVELGPTNPDLLFLRARALRGAGRGEEAVRELKRAAALSEGENVPEGAIACYHLILKITPEDQDAKRAMVRLRRA